MFQDLESSSIFFTNHFRINLWIFYVMEIQVCQVSHKMTCLKEISFAIFFTSLHPLEAAWKFDGSKGSHQRWLQIAGGRLGQRSEGGALQGWRGSWLGFPPTHDSRAVATEKLRGRDSELGN